MKFLQASLIILILFNTACVNNVENSLNISASSPEKRIDSLLNQWHQTATEADYETYFGIMDSVSVFIGTDASENWTKEQFAAFSKPYFDNGKAWSFKAFDRNIYFDQDSSTAWFDELLDTWMGTCRGSGVLELVGDYWKLKQYVLSVSIPNESIQTIITEKQSLDSVFRASFLD